MTIWYGLGTVEATNGSTTITGALTAWLAMAKPGDEIYFDADARGYEVASIASNTSMEISPAYAGTTGSGKAYRLKPIGPGWNSVTELSTSVAELLTLVGNEITNGVGVPSNDEGNDGDTYIRTDVPSIYAKESGTWVLKATISGPTGDPGPSYQATSTSSVAIGTGSKTFTIQSGRGYSAGQWVRASNSASNYMEGTVTSYSSTTLIINVPTGRAIGSGTFTSWNVNIAGDPGPTNSLTIGSVTASDPGASASASITGAAPSQTLNLVLPRGATGPANSLSIGTVEQGSAAASITGDAPTQTLNLVLPKGDAATIEVGNVTTVDPGDPATVTNSGTSAEAVFDFEIPKGDPGSDGASVDHMGAYDNGTTYSYNQEVLSDGSSWRYINETPGSGNAPPTYPTESDTYWQLTARRGQDGSGAVDSVNGKVGAVEIDAASLGLEIGVDVQAYDVDLTAISSLTPTDGNIIVGDGSTWVTESGATLRTSIGVGTTDNPQFASVNIGHATDTTITRAAAGQIAVEGSRVYQRSNILGAVSESSGVPTGGVIERGSNANGSYVRYADGTQECWVNGVSINITTAMGSLFRGFAGWTFPAAFVSTTELSVFSCVQDTTAVDCYGGNALVTGASSCTFRVWGATSRSGVSCGGFAVGRWF